ncbi:CWF19-like protein 1 [Stylophora pistillata]|uniref:CWF19-like protein 1 n=1 Tax=Stylophora pistillata TaxID=50429 RepID=A0A2B4SBM0_STYPI|nr:CWF19-like protein 1 [Stylophora pistillata]
MANFQIVPVGAPYFVVEFDNEDKLLHRVSSKMPLQFGREVAASPALLNMPDRVHWKACKVSEDEETKMAGAFRKKFQPKETMLSNRVKNSLEGNKVKETLQVIGVVPVEALKEEEKKKKNTRESYLSWCRGEFSRFFIQTVTKSGQLKRTGGDSWRVHIRQGPASLAPIVIDHTDGTYEVMFLALEPGNYSAQAFLDFTLCDGFRDPPEDWYIRGDIQGHKQETGILGDIDQDFIKAPLQNGKPINFCIEECNETNEMHKTQYAGKRVKRKLDDLMFYGDSTNVHFHSLARRNRLCKEMFHTCEKKYMWTYDVSEEIETLSVI